MYLITFIVYFVGFGDISNGGLAVKVGMGVDRVSPTIDTVLISSLPNMPTNQAVASQDQPTSEPNLVTSSEQNATASDILAPPRMILRSMSR